MAFVAVASLAIVLAAAAPSRAAGVDGHGFGGGHPGGAPAHNGFEGRHFDGDHFEGHHFDGRFRFGPVFPYYGYSETPGYWYYCPSYGAYYPSVTSCPEAWVPVPAS
jgi:hypothetical protein